MKRLSYLGAVILLLLSLSAISTAALVMDENASVTPGEMITEQNATENQTVADMIGQEENLSTLAAAVEAANLTENLSGEGPFTVFAPNDEAFDAIENMTLEELLNDTEMLSEVLQFHVVEGRYTADELKNMTMEAGGNQTMNMTGAGNETTLTTLTGENITISMTGDRPMVEDAGIVMADLNATNGIVHVIDTVLMPENATDAGNETANVTAMLQQQNMTAPEENATGEENATENMTVDQVIAQEENLSTLAAAIEAANLTEDLSGEGPFTVFAPNDEAFDAMENMTLEELLNDTEMLSEVLQFHVVEGLYTSENLTEMASGGEDGGFLSFEWLFGDGGGEGGSETMLTTLTGENLTLAMTDDNLTVNGAAVVQPDINASNGVVHVIDTVLEPENVTGQEENATDNATNQTAPQQTSAAARVKPGAQGWVTVSETPAPELEEANVTDEETNVTEEEENVTDGETIADMIEQEENLSTFATAIETANKTEKLSGEGPFTVFAPNDEAFEAMENMTVEELLNDTHQLTRVVLHHIILGNYTTEDLIAMTGGDEGNATMTENMSGNVTDNQTGNQTENATNETVVRTVLGELVRVSRVDDRLIIDGAEIVQPDIDASNGIVHVIDTVLMPYENVTVPEEENFTVVIPGVEEPEENVTPEENITSGENVTPEDNVTSEENATPGENVTGETLLGQVIMQEQNLSTFSDAVEAANLTENFNSAGPYTVFAPNNEAFDAMENMTLEELLNDTDMLIGVIEFHVVEGEYTADDLREMTMGGGNQTAGTNETGNATEVTLSTVGGQTLNVSSEGGRIMVEGAGIVQSDINASNGVLHVIDTVLQPENVTEEEDVTDNATSGGNVTPEENATTGDNVTGVVPAMNVTPEENVTPPGRMTGNYTVAEVIAQDGNLSTLARAVDAANLTENLSRGGPFTCFAPNDDAFDAIENMTLEELLNDTEMLSEVLQFHVVEGRYTADELKNMTMEAGGNQTMNMTGAGNETTLTTLTGENITISMTGDRLMVEDAGIIMADLNATNGIVHVIDTVLMPENTTDAGNETANVTAMLQQQNMTAPEENATGEENATENMTVDQVIAQEENLSTLAAAIEAANLTEDLSGEGPFTVFAPNNEAFDAMENMTLEELLNDTEMLSEVLQFHVVEGLYTSENLTEMASGGEDGGFLSFEWLFGNGGGEGGNETTLTTLTGENVTLAMTDDNLTVNGAAVVQPDINASNGVVHVIDTVLEPENVTGQEENTTQGGNTTQS